MGRHFPVHRPAVSYIMKSVTSLQQCDMINLKVYVYRIYRIDNLYLL